METVKANFKQVTNVNPVTETEEIQLQGSAIVKSLGTNWLETKSEDPKRYKVGSILLDVNGTPEVKSAQIFEKTLNGNPKKGTEPIKAGDIVSINVSSDGTNTYFRVIGAGSGSLDSADTFASLLGATKTVAKTAEKAKAAPAAETASAPAMQG